MYFNRTPDLSSTYPIPVSKKVLEEDRMKITVQVDSLITLRNRETHGIKVISSKVDTIIY